MIVVADSSNWKVGVPALTTSLRGLVDGTIEVRVLEHAVHSGMFGGPVLDAPTLLARLIATLHDDDGSRRHRRAGRRDDAASVDYPEEDFRRDSSVLDGVKLAGTGSIASRLWTKPALSMIGIDAPSGGRGLQHPASARPGPSSACAWRPARTPTGPWTRWLPTWHAHAPFGAEVMFTPGERGQAFATDTTAPAARTALWALEQAWGVAAGGDGHRRIDPVHRRPDGALPAGTDPDHRCGRPRFAGARANESLHLGDFRNAVLAEALLLARVNEEGI